jgi:predicted TIM-barrel fold metal-dependent hydrolase
MRAIDADGHVTEPDSIWTEYLPQALHPFAPRRVHDNEGRSRQLIGGELKEFIPTAPHWGPFGPRRGGSDPKQRLADMDSEGIELSVLFPTTGLYFPGVGDLAIQAALCRAYNDWLADFCRADPRRLIGVALIPQADVAASLAELRRCVEQHGFRGVMVRPNPIRGRNLDDPYYHPLWELAEELDVAVAVHEGTTQDVVQSGRDRFTNFMFRHVCSHPHEMQMALLALVCGGVLERYPRLRFAFLESGCGWIAWWLERMHEHLEHWGHASQPLPSSPEEYFRRQCFISSEPDERTLPAVIALLGDEQILFASDYPHPDGIWPGVVRAMSEREDLSATSKTRVLRDNAARCFGLG